MIMTVITNEALLPLLKRLEWDKDGDCPECRLDARMGHNEGCQLKVVLDQFEAYEADVKRRRDEYLEGQA